MGFNTHIIHYYQITVKILVVSIFSLSIEVYIAVNV